MPMEYTYRVCQTFGRNLALNIKMISFPKTFEVGNVFGGLLYHNQNQAYAQTEETQEGEFFKISETRCS